MIIYMVSGTLGERANDLKSNRDAVDPIIMQKLVSLRLLLWVLQPYSTYNIPVYAYISISHAHLQRDRPSDLGA